MPGWTIPAFCRGVLGIKLFNCRTWFGPVLPFASNVLLKLDLICLGIVDERDQVLEGSNLDCS